jgi:hypothetical protein
VKKSRLVRDLGSLFSNDSICFCVAQFQYRAFGYLRSVPSGSSTEEVCPLSPTVSATVPSCLLLFLLFLTRDCWGSDILLLSSHGGFHSLSRQKMMAWTRTRQVR